jgi:hypothetical protein
MVTRHPKLVIEIFYLDGPPIIIYILFLTAINLKCPPPVHEWGGGAMHIRESGGRTSVYCFTLYILKYRVCRLQQIKGRVSQEMLHAYFTRDKGAWRNIYPFGNEIKSKECSTRIHGIHVRVKRACLTRFRFIYKIGT